jgi:hypothetical protein
MAMNDALKAAEVDLGASKFRAINVSVTGFDGLKRE